MREMVFLIPLLFGRQLTNEVCPRTLRFAFGKTQELGKTLLCSFQVPLQ